MLIAVAGLYVLHFTNSSVDESDSEIVADTLKTQERGEKIGRIYYVNTDTVWENYGYVQEVTARLEGRKNQYERQLQTEVSNFEREVNEFREKGAMMSEVELQIKQRSLVQKESELAKMGEELEMKFITEEKEWNDKLRKKIIDFIDQTTSDRNYDYILGYSSQSNIILTNDSLDLTHEVIQGLNAEYESEKAEKK